MTVVEKTVLAAGSASTGTYIWGVSAGEIHGWLEFGTAGVAFLCFIVYLTFLFRRLKMSNKVGQADLEARKAEVEAHKAEVEAHKADADANRKKAAFYEQALNSGQDD